MACPPNRFSNLAEQLRLLPVDPQITAPRLIGHPSLLPVIPNLIRDEISPVYNPRDPIGFLIQLIQGITLNPEAAVRMGKQTFFLRQIVLDGNRLTLDMRGRKEVPTQVGNRQVVKLLAAVPAVFTVRLVTGKTQKLRVFSSRLQPQKYFS